MNVLLVDDSKTVRYILNKMLRELGYSQIIEASSGREALEKLKVEDIGLILSDVNMPGINGLDFLKSVRSNNATKDIPFVMVTTVHDKSIIMDAVKAGLQFYILKPVDKNVLFQKLLSLSKTHNIQAPIKKVMADSAAPAEKAPSPDEKPEGACKEMTEKCINEIIDHFFLVFDGELTMDDFKDWVAIEVFGDKLNADTMKEVDMLIQKMRASASDGIKSMLATHNK